MVHVGFLLFVISMYQTLLVKHFVNVVLGAALCHCLLNALHLLVLMSCEFCGTHTHTHTQRQAFSLSFKIISFDLHKCWLSSSFIHYSCEVSSQKSHRGFVHIKANPLFKLSGALSNLNVMKQV